MIEVARKALLENNKESFKKAIGLCSLKQINEVDEQGNTLLHIAVQKGSLGFVKYLLAKGVDISLLNKNGDSALHQAVRQGYFNIVHEMLGISPAAKDRKRKATWTDKDRSDKLTLLKNSQSKALALLNTPNNEGEIPLIIAARLNDDLIYKKLLLLKSAPGYSKNQIDKALSLRQKHIENLKNKSFWSAILETFCPSASVAELTESFAYTGLLAGASAAVGLGLNIAFAVISIIGFSAIMYANYKKNQSEKNAAGELEELQAEQAFLQSIRKRVAYLSSQQSLTADDKKELKLMQEELTNSIQKPILVKGDEKSAADYVTRKDKTLAALSSVGSFLCTYSGLLGITGLGLGIAATIMGTSLSALIVATGPIGISAALGVGLILAGALAFYHYQSRKQSYLVFGEQRELIYELQYANYKEQQDLIHGSDKVLTHIDELLQESSPKPIKSRNENPVTEKNTPVLDKYNHGHKPGEICSIEIKQLTSNGFMKQTQNVMNTITVKTLNTVDEHIEAPKTANIA
ncbi:ankyrin repeat domain-containing protein [Legionella longbeachae]|uniref:Ankyrin repeat protein n=1 Tax=Legionella longbeachae serogroup 1 (strain NSW150) TaxID=661367 RepID=D3HS75_LEGLN|nr:ankyrin repeat domain-containing protein [Legionella longbeachae]VEE02259.1 Ankyrin repeat protein [Legionella oakridgensis]HBD7399332.1 ankyrin repeat domain-containing protein [Legionella pneumophila]ARB91445.1 ankyrin repeat domain-containing protein [Legionella longbeachae]EEZ95106.1 ankyrin repeat-containing protein [Legionella longbeachae D-4968]QIN32129.1 ankyrin repeat domain-containing protein [Legionella longbeachae]